MIKILEDYFVLETSNTSYIFGIDEVKHLVHYYYGKKIDIDDNSINNLKSRREFAIGNGISYSEDKQNITMESQLLEVSFLGKGDLRNPLIDLTFEDGSSSSDFVFSNAKTRIHTKMKTLPTSYDEENKIEELVISLKDEIHQIELNIIYTPFEKENVITRRMEIINHSDKEVVINKAMSLQLDMINKDFDFISFHGSWIREMKKYVQPCVIGTILSESICGVSSSRSNPFVMLASKNANEEYGEVYAFNLVYSGNHLESVETDTYSHIRLLSGIHPYTFKYVLNKDEIFETPEGVMTYSSNGFRTMSHNMHNFVSKHIIKGEWRDVPRPILNNSWEAAYFKFDQAKIIQMAKKASKAGIELFVLDDGWFGDRNDDTKALGDWSDNKKKLPQGLKGLSKKINDLGMDFGIWVEPEMISENSLLYKKHPEWVIKNPNAPQSLGRHQMILDLSQDEVVDYLIDVLSDIFKRSNCKYVKWDMNRIFSDYFSQKLDGKHMKELSHRYYIGFYRLMEELTSRFPYILFEGCASGGNRFDLGILSYFPQIWASDNSDARGRMEIQEGYSYGYPLSTLGCHVSDIPNHQTLRKCSLYTRYNVAFFGNLGYEFNFNEISKEDYKEAVRQIEEYKNYRKYLFNGDFYRIKSDDGYYHFEVVSKDKKHAAYLFFQTTNKSISEELYLDFKGLSNDTQYSIHSIDYHHNIMEFGGLVNQISPIHIKNGSGLHKLLSKFIKMNERGENIVSSGSLLNNSLLPVSNAFVGTGFNDKTRLMFDNDSRLYLVDYINEKEEI